MEDQQEIFGKIALLAAFLTRMPFGRKAGASGGIVVSTPEIGWSTTGSWITPFTLVAFGPPASLESGAQRTKQLERVGGFFQDFRES
jgi:hypothetical protein